MRVALPVRVTQEGKDRGDDDMLRAKLLAEDSKQVCCI